MPGRKPLPMVPAEKRLNPFMHNVEIWPKILQSMFDHLHERLNALL